MLTVIIIVVILVLLIVGLVYFVVIYNRFQELRNAAEATLRQIQVALKKRLDMITQLVESTRGYMAYEKDVLEKITELRSKVGYLANIPEVLRESTGLLGRLLAIVENYPDLKASQPVQELMKVIREIEDEIARYRYTYNNIIQEYNTMIDVFPSNIVASIFGFKKLQYLEFGEEVGRRPEIRLY